MSALNVDNAYVNGIDEYLQKKGETFYIYNIEDEATEMLSDFLQENTAQHDLFLFYAAEEVGDSSFFVKQKTFAVTGKTHVLEKVDTYVYMNFSVIDPSALKKVSEDENVCISGTGGCAYRLPYFQFGTNISFVNYGKWASWHNNVNGTYYLVGNKADKDLFFTELSSILQVDKDTLFEKKQGSDVSSPQYFFFISLWGISIFLFAVSCVVILVRSLSDMGKILLLGYSRFSFIWDVLRLPLLSVFVLPFFFVVFAYIMSYGSIFNFSYISTFVFYGVLSLVVSIVATLPALLVVYQTSSINAIRHRYSHRLLIGMTLGLYALASVGVAGMGHIISDGVLKEISHKREVMNAWSSVQDMHVISHVQTGNDEASFSMLSSAYAYDLYEWYSSFARDKDVFYVYAEDYNSQWSKKLYDEVQLPEHDTYFEDDYVLMNVSPEYMSHIGISFDDSMVKKAHEGHRVYFMHSTVAEQEKKNVCKVITTENMMDVDKTHHEGILFGKEKNTYCETYEYDRGVFTWNADLGKNVYADAQHVVFSLVVPENMTYTNVTSLQGVGFDGSVLKMSESAVSKYMNNEYTRSFHLDDNELQTQSIYASISAEIDEYKTMMYFYGSILLFSMFLAVISLIVVFYLYRIAFDEKLNVQRFLGEGIAKLYMPLLLMCGITACALYAYAYAYGNVFSYVVTSIFVTIEVFLLYVLARKNDVSSIVTFLKTQQ